MAQARNAVEYVTPAPVEQHFVDLRMSPQEAATLAVLLARVDGNPASPREDTDSILNALTGLGVKPRHNAQWALVSGSVRFRDYVAPVTSP